MHLSIDNTTVQRNSKEGIAGQTQFLYNPVITVTNTTVQSNYDGGIESVGDLTILDSLVTGNTRSFFGGGGVVVGAAELTIERSEITNNMGDACGAGVTLNGTVARIRDTTISHNQSDRCAGVCVYNEGQATIRRSAIFSNTVTGDSGGIYVLEGEVDLSNVTIARNIANADDDLLGTGGGFMVDTISTVQFDMINSLIAINSLGDGNRSDCIGTITSGGTNLVRVADGCNGLIGSDLTGTDSSPLNAKLGDLQDRGGYTWVIPFGVNSPAADTGNQSVCTSQPVNGFDQRGYSRIDVDGNEDGGIDGNNCDIGAFERNARSRYDLFLPILFE